MTELGLTLAWVAVQVTLVLAPALALNALASRRGPAAGAWVAAVSLGLVVALDAAAFLPGPGAGPGRGGGGSAGASLPADSSSPAEPSGAPTRDAPARPAGGGRSLTGLRVAWARFGRGAAEPAARCRPWGGVLASLALAGTAAGLLRLAFDLGAVVACRWRGAVVDDPEMVGLLDELRGAFGCRSAVELREVPGLTGPAAAGWRRPAVLLPDDWRSWNGPERRAVLAHELAHVVGGDYATGLLARVAVALNCYHPLVCWTAGRLRLQQELAADALGARHSGGREAYLVALSRLALRQDERSPCRPARAFLPARGTLIRRIAMLRQETRTATTARPWSGARRLSTALLLLGVTAAVATLRGPARGSADDAPATTAVTTDAGPSFVPPYLPAGSNAVVVLRPAAALRHAGMDRLAVALVGTFEASLSEIAKGFDIDTSGPKPLKLDLKDLEWVTFGVSFDSVKGKKGAPLHRVMINPAALRTAAPFDWLAYLWQWRFEFAEARDGGRPYFKIMGAWKEILGANPCVYLPDDRTLILGKEAAIRELAVRGAPARPAFLSGEDWERACRGVLAVAVDNEGDSFVKSYDQGRPDDAVALSLFKGVDRWVFAVDDAGSIALDASAACRDADAGRAVAAAVESVLTLANAAVDHADPAATAAGAHDRARRMCKSLLAGLRVRRPDRSVALRAEGLGTLADFASIVEAVVAEEKSTDRAGEAGTRGPKR